MTILNRDIVNDPTLALLSKLAATKLPGAAAFKIGSNIDAIQKVVEAFNKQRTALVEKHTAKDEVGKVLRPLKPDGTPDEAAVQLSEPEAFAKAMEELLTVDVTDICPILIVKLSELGAYEFEPREASLIKWMLAL